MENVIKKFQQVAEFFSPRIIAEVNDVYVKIARIKGDKVPWHIHKLEDELFYVLEGKLLVEIKGEESFEMTDNDIYVIRKGKEHRVSSEHECRIMLIENKSTAHTGDVQSEITRTIDEQM